MTTALTGQRPIGGGRSTGRTTPRSGSIFFVAVSFVVSAGIAAQASPNIETLSRKNPTTEQTSADELTWLLTFTEPVTHVHAADFVVSGTTATLGLAPLALDEEACSDEWDATLSGGDLAYLNGTVALTPAKFREDLDGPCLGGADEPCIWGCLGNGERMTHPGPRSRNENTFVVSNTDPPRIPTVRLSASPNPVREGESVTVKADLSEALSGSSVTVPLVLTAGTAEMDDYGTLDSILINPGSTSGTGRIATAQDDDADDETFTVELGSLPPSIRAGKPRSVMVTIREDEGTRPPANRPPTVSASCAPCAVESGAQVRLTASASDPDNDGLTYRWTASQGRFVGAIDQASARWAASVPVGRYAVGVRVSDGRGGAASAEVAIEVTPLPPPPNRPPTFGRLSYVFELREGVSGPAELGEVAADDPDGDPLTYALARGDGERFTVGATDGSVMYVGTGEDFEAGPSRFELIVRARDSFGGEAAVDVVVMVIDVNETPLAVGTIQKQQLEEGAGADAAEVTMDVGPFFEDPDGDELTYSAATSNSDIAIVSMAGSRLAISASGEGQASVTVTARDPEGLSVAQTVEVTVESVGLFRWVGGWRLKLLTDSADRAGSNAEEQSEP